MAERAPKTGIAGHRHYIPADQRHEVRSFARRNKVNYPVLFGSKKTKELFDRGDTLTFSVVIDRDGIIKALIEGVIFGDEFDEKIKPLLTPPDVKPPA